MLASLCNNLHEIQNNKQKVKTNSLHKNLENTIDDGLYYKTRGQTLGDLLLQQIVTEHLLWARHC